MVCPTGFNCRFGWSMKDAREQSRKLPSRAPSPALLVALSGLFSHVHRITVLAASNHETRALACSMGKL
jgi:hypothetical protein